MTKEFCKNKEKYAVTSPNKRIEYTMVEEWLYSEELSVYYRTYGIAAFRNGRQINFVSDVSIDRYAVETLVRKCNKYALDPVHLYDVIEDFLS